MKDMTKETEHLYVAARFLTASKDAKEIPPILEYMGGKHLDEVEKVNAVHCYNMGRLWEYLHSEAVDDETGVVLDELALEKLLADKSMGEEDICTAVYDAIGKAFRFGYYKALWDRRQWA